MKRKIYALILICIYVVFAMGIMPSFAANDGYIVWNTLAEVNFTQAEKESGVFGFPAGFSSRITESFPSEGGYKVVNPSGVQEAMTIVTNDHGITQSNDKFMAGVIWNSNRGEGSNIFSLFINDKNGGTFAAIRAEGGMIKFGTTSSVSSIFLGVPFDQTSDVEAAFIFDPVAQTMTPTINGVPVGEVEYQGMTYPGYTSYSGAIPACFGLSMWLNWCNAVTPQNYLHLKKVYIDKGYDPTQECSYDTITDEDPTKITHDLTLMTALNQGDDDPANDATVEWRSSKPHVISDNAGNLGAVTRQQYDEMVTLSACITYNGQQLPDKNFHLIVLGENKEENYFMLDEARFTNDEEHCFLTKTGGKIGVTDGKLTLTRNGEGELSATKYFVTNFEQKPYTVRYNEVILEQYLTVKNGLDSAKVQVYNENSEPVTSYGIEKSGADYAFTCSHKNGVASISYTEGTEIYVRLVFDSTSNTFRIFVDNTELNAETEKQTLNSAGISFIRFLADGQEGQFGIDNVALMIYEPNKAKAAVEMDALNVKFSDFTSQSPDAVTRDLVLPTKATFGSTLTYVNEEQPGVLSNFGFVTRQDQDVTFPLIVKVKNGSEEKSLPPFQITVKGQDPKNLVLNKIIYVSNELVGYEAANAVDQVETTAWKTDAPNPFLTVNLGKETMFNKVVLQEAKNESEVFGVRNFTIEVSNNNRTWTPVYTDGTTIGEGTAVTFEQVSAKYVRYSVNEFEGTQTGLYELGVYYAPIPSIAIELDLADIKVTPSDYIVRSNLSLTSACTNGSAVSWKSSHPAILSHSGTLLATPETDTVVTLTATLQNGMETRTKDFKVLVCAVRSGGSSGGIAGDRGVSSPVKGVTSPGIIKTQNGSENASRPVTVFPDVPEDRWSHDYIKELQEAGIVEGDGGNFHPTRTVTREEFVKMLVLSLDIEQGGTVAFSDAENGAWYEAFIATAVYNGITQGTSDETFGIGQEITRQDMAVMVMRALAAKDKTIELGAAPIFSDGNKIAPYAKDAVAYLAAAGILGGDGENFHPEESLTREQAAKVLCLIRKELAS